MTDGFLGTDSKRIGKKPGVDNSRANQMFGPEIWFRIFEKSSSAIDAI